MPIIRSAKKALRVSARRRIFNLRRKDKVTLAMKNLKKFIADKNKHEATNSLSLVYKALDKAVKSGLIKKNTAARKKSRLSATIKAIA